MSAEGKNMGFQGSNIVKLLYKPTLIKGRGWLSAVSLAVVLLIANSGFARNNLPEKPELLPPQEQLKLFDDIVKGTEHEIPPRQFEQRFFKWSAEQFSHIVRLTQMQRLLVNPHSALRDFAEDFKKEFPREAKAFLGSEKQAVDISSNHDGEKSLQSTDHATRGLVRADGMTYRSLLEGKSKSLDPEEAKTAGKLIKNWIDTINAGEPETYGKRLDDLSPNAEFKRAHLLVTKAMDLYDVDVNRTDIGANRLSASQMVDKLRLEGKLDDLNDEDFKFLKNFCLYLEKKNVLKNHPKLFVQPDYFMKRGIHDMKGLKAAFHMKTQSLINSTTNFPTSQSLAKKAASAKHSVNAATSTDGGSRGADAPGGGKALTNASEEVATGFLGAGAVKRMADETKSFIKGQSKRALKAGGLSLGVAAVGTYLIDPENTDGNDIIANFAGANETASCDSVLCQQFINECGRKLECMELKEGKNSCLAKIKKANDFREHVPQTKLKFSEVTGHKQFASACVKSFLKLPLQVQAEKRSSDSNLDNLLAPYSPTIRNLTCSKDAKGKVSAEIEILNRNKNRMNSDNYFQKLVFNSRKRVESLERIPASEPQVKNQLFINGDQVAMLEHCVDGRDCRKFKMEEIKDIKLGFWRDDRISGLFGMTSGKVPIDAVKWARLNQQLVENQSDQVHNCCGDKACHGYFSKRVKDFNQAKSRAVSMNGAK